MEQQIGDLHEARLLGQLVDRIAAVEQDALVAVDVGDRALAAGGRGEAGVVGELVRFAVELADIDDVRADRAFQQRVGEFAAIGGEFDGLCRSFVRLQHLIGDAGEAFVLAQQDKHVEDPRRGRLARQRRTQRLGEFA